MNDTSQIPGIPPDDPLLPIMQTLDNIKEGLQKGVITQLGIIALNDSGTMLGSSVLLYPYNMLPLTAMGVSEAFRAAVLAMIYNPMNGPQFMGTPH